MRPNTPHAPQLFYPLLDGAVRKDAHAIANHRQDDAGHSILRSLQRRTGKCRGFRTMCYENAPYRKSSGSWCHTLLPLRGNAPYVATNRVPTEYQDSVERGWPIMALPAMHDVDRMGASERLKTTVNHKDKLNILYCHCCCCF